jgi:hypothetical protein
MIKEIKMVENEQNVQNNNEYIYEMIDDIVDGADDKTNINIIEKDLNKIFRKDIYIKSYSIIIKCLDKIEILESQIFIYVYSISLAWVDSLNKLNHYVTLKTLSTLLKGNK